MILFDGFEWACLTSKESELPCDLLIDSIGSERKNPFLPPRVLVRAHSERLIPVQIDRNHPRILSIIISRQDRKDAAKMMGFITCAYEILIAHWNKALDDYETLSRLFEMSKGSFIM